MSEIKLSASKANNLDPSALSASVIDLSSISIKTANEMIRGYGAAHQDIEIINPDAKHYIAVGLTNPVNVSINGSAGYFCGGLSDGPYIEVKNNVSWGVGDNMLSGTIIVGGNAGAIAGEALRGGNIIIKGNMGSRAGQVMKKGTLCCVGNSNFMAGYMMYGGRIIILGNSGEKVGENMAGGEIYVGGSIESLGADAVVVDPSDADIESVMKFLSSYSIPFAGRLQKVVCAGKELKYGNAEPSIKSIPFTKFSGNNTNWWNEKVQEDIKVKSQIGRYRVRGYGTSRHVPHFGDIAFKHDISTLLKLQTLRQSNINMRTFIGSRNGGKALDLSMPVLIAPMSLGALSPRVKTALGIASRLSGICENTGEGGMYSIERAEARQLIAQCLSGRLGWNIHDMKRSDGLELYISQGAKPGLGGQLMAAKLTKEIAQMRGIPHGMDLRSPSRHPDILGGDDLIMKVLELREAVGWRLPVSLKLGGGRTRDDIKIAYKDGIDFVELDGLQGGTGAGGNEVIEYVGIPTISALMEAVDGLDEIDATGELPIVIMGGIQSGVDAAKAIALGATAVGIGTSMLIAAGCTGCMQCSSGNCPVGITTQTPKYVERFDIDKQAFNMHRYLESFRWQLTAIVSALGHSDVHELCRDDLVALTPEAAALTRLPYLPDYVAKGSSKRKSNSGSNKENNEDNGHSLSGTTNNETCRDFHINNKKNTKKDQETGTANFPKISRDLIKRMSQTSTKDSQSQLNIMNIALQGRENPFPLDRPAHLDDVVFLSAALTRLVIDPYRENCSTKTRITRTIEVGQAKKGVSSDSPAVEISQPFMFTGFDTAPDYIKAVLGSAISACGCGYIGRIPLNKTFRKEHGESLYLKDTKTVGEAAINDGIIECSFLQNSKHQKLVWFQLLLPDDTPSSEADALIYVTDTTHANNIGEKNINKYIQSYLPKRLNPNQLVGICADAKTLPAVLPHALNKKFDILLIDTTAGITKTWVELNTLFDLTVIRDTILRLRSMNMEEEISLINFGGLRSGTDVAKSLALNCNASVFGAAMGIALGGTINGNTLEFAEHSSDTASIRNCSNLYNAAVNWIKGTSQEAAIIARCAGKTDVHNLEPEDMRSISIATSEALGIPLTSGAVKRQRF